MERRFGNKAISWERNARHVGFWQGVLGQRVWSGKRTGIM